MPFSYGVVTGTFDVIHPGYIHLFRQAKRHCDSLIVLVREQAIESKTPVVVPLADRLDTLRGIRYVDIINIYDTEEKLYSLLAAYQSNLHRVIRVMGDDYLGKDFTGKDLFKEEDVVYVDRSHGWSTSKYKQMIADSLKKVD